MGAWWPQALNEDPPQFTLGTFMSLKHLPLPKRCGLTQSHLSPQESDLCVSRLSL